MGAQEISEFLGKKCVSQVENAKRFGAACQCVHVWFSSPGWARGVLLAWCAGRQGDGRHHLIMWKQPCWLVFCGCDQVPTWSVLHLPTGNCICDQVEVFHSFHFLPQDSTLFLILFMRRSNSIPPLFMQISIAWFC